VAAEVRKALETQGLRLWLWSTSSRADKLLLFGHRHQQPHGVELSFEPGDQAIAKAALSVYLGLTEQRSAKRALQSAKIDYRTLFESAHDAFVIIDALSNQVIEVNAQALDLLGVSLSELQRHPLYSWLADPDPSLWRRWWRRRSRAERCRPSVACAMSPERPYGSIYG
jgi:PAS domain S-box-containing protein